MNKILSLAIVKHLGYGTEMYPKEDKLRLINEFGADKAEVLFFQIDKILDETDNIVKSKLENNVDCAIGIMQERHPELNQEALRALHWAFSFWWK